MSSIESFFRQEPKKNGFYVASERFKDKDGKPIEWELKHIPNKQMEAIKQETNFFTDESARLGRFAIEAILASVVYPSLRDHVSSWKTADSSSRTARSSDVSWIWG